MNRLSCFGLKQRNLRWMLLVALCAGSAMFWASARPASAQDQVVQDGASLYLPLAANAPAPPPLCRMGVNITRLTTEEFSIADLRVGWFIDYRATLSVSFANNAVHAPVINLAQVGDTGNFTSLPSGAALDAAIAAQPGADWIIGNEPDRRYYQNDLEPAVYARAFHDLALQIRAKDPTARLFAGAIVQPTPLRLQYLDLVLSEYRKLYGEALPADGWAIHNFILNERSCRYYDNDPYICWGADIPPGINATDGLVIELNELQKTADVNFFKEQIVRFRQWMANNGYRNLPLYVSEYGILMPPDFGFSSALVNQYMNDTFDYMLTETSAQLGYAADENRLVQRFAWYSTLDPSFNGSLFQSTTDNPLSPPFRRTAMGDNFVAYANTLQASSAFKLLSLAQLPVSAQNGSAPSVTLRVTLANGGNNQWPASGRVQFYWGDPATDGVALGARVVSLVGCGRTATVDFVWDNVPAEANGQRVYARLQAPGVDTQASVQIVLIKDLLFLPKAQRPE